MRKKDLFCAAFVMILLSGCSEFEWNPDFSSCGNRLIEIHEQCDDGNQADGDGCSDKCQIEEGYECLLVGQQCTELCGNGRRDPKEQCDDGNKGDGDGCSKTCDIEEGWYSYNDELCQIICGNGVMDPDEQCDDRNTNDNDGCSNECKLEEGWYLKDNTLYHMECGNGVLDPGEQCDDENKVDGDGCSKTCEIEWGYECQGTGQSCKKLCGNGKRDPGEQCDFARTGDEKGCTDACQVKNGWYFNQAQALVEIECGNGTLDPGEQCDDGDTDDDNGCSRTCRVKEGWICPPTGPCFLKNSCGNGIVNHNEQCDDGNPNHNDGCNECILEDGWYLDEDLILKPSICGNSIKEPNETCDDGNSNAKDGCNDKCHIEDGYECLNLGQPCTKLCGNNILDENEQCDDGNTADGDRCSATCQIEDYCGNGVPDNGEECDDGNLNLNDGCSPLCTTMLNFSNSQCGDGYITGFEECDDGNTNDSDGCSSTCTLESMHFCISNIGAASYYLPVIIRDFRGIDDGNKGEDGKVNDNIINSVNNEQCKFKKEDILKEFNVDEYGTCANIVIEQQLNANEKPWLSTPVEHCYSCPDSLDFWYTDNELNIKYLHTLHTTSSQYTGRFSYKSKDDNSIYRFIYNNKNIKNIYTLWGKKAMLSDNTNFLPLGNLKYKNNFSNSSSILEENDFLGGDKVNNQFTLEAKGYFQFKPDENGKVIMKFNADDSIWVFINYKLALDFGGAHSADETDRVIEILTTPREFYGVKEEESKSKTIMYNEEFNLVEGGFYPIHIFFAERGGGSVLNIDTPLIYSPSICKPK